MTYRFASPLALCLALCAGCQERSHPVASNAEGGAAGAVDGDQGGAPESAGSTSAQGGAESAMGGEGGAPVAEGGAAGSGADSEAGGEPSAAGSASAGEAGAGGMTGGLPAVEVVSVSPGQHELHVAPLVSVVIQLSGAIDESSLRTPPAILAPKAGVGVPAQVTYDPLNHTITIDPKLPLTAGALYRVSLGGARDLAGNALELASDFRVAFQSSTLIRYYTLEGKQTSGYRYELNDEGRVARRIDISATGDDGELGTQDDVVSGYYEYSWVKDADESGTTSYNGPGLDKEWFTEDDARSGRSFSSTPTVGENHSGYRSIGKDGVWGTDDDGWSSFCRSSYGQDGREAKFLCFSGGGNDEQPFSDDDPISYYFLDSYLPGVEPYENGSVQWRPSFGGAGKDGLWLTDDDTVSAITETRFDEDLFAHLVLQISAGGDAQAGTKDDMVNYAISNERGESGLVMRRTKLMGPGKDGAWETPDDELAPDAWRYKYDIDGRLVWMGLFAAGVDGQPHTDDDVLTYEEVHDSPL